MESQDITISYCTCYILKVDPFNDVRDILSVN